MAKDNVFKQAKKLGTESGRVIDQGGNPAVMTKKTPQPSSTPKVSAPTMTMGKAWSAVKWGADAVGLDGKMGFQNSFGSIKGMGKVK